MFPSSFAYQPRATYSPLPLHAPFSSAIPETALDFDAYDAQRTALEQRALAAKQQERRAGEIAALRRHHHQLEVERRQRDQEALYEALVQRQAEEEAYAAAVEQHRRREQARIVAAREAAQEQAAYISEVQRRRSAAATAHAREQAEEHRRRLAAQQAAHREAHERPAESIHPLQSLFEQLLGASPRETGDTASSAHAGELVPPPVPSFPPATPIPSAEPIEKPPALEISTPLVDDDSTEEAATTLQRHFRAHLARRSALANLATLASSLNAQQSAFVPPTSLVFQPYNGSTPKLAYSPTNAPFLAHEDFLVGLLTKVDAVQSGGDKFVKTARKDLVHQIERELKRLDELKDGEWEKLGAGDPEKSADKGVEMTEDAAPLPTVPVLTTDDATAPVAQTSPVDASVALDDLIFIPSANTPPEDANASKTKLDLAHDTAASTPLTPAALASVPSTRPPRSATSDSDSTDTDSTIAVDLGDEFLDEIMKLAGKFGSKSKCARRPRLAGREGFVWV